MIEVHEPEVFFSMHHAITITNEASVTLRFTRGPQLPWSTGTLRAPIEVFLGPLLSQKSLGRMWGINYTWPLGVCPLSMCTVLTYAYPQQHGTYGRKGILTSARQFENRRLKSTKTRVTTAYSSPQIPQAQIVVQRNSQSPPTSRFPSITQTHPQVAPQ